MSLEEESGPPKIFLRHVGCSSLPWSNKPAISATGVSISHSKFIAILQERVTAGQMPAREHAIAPWDSFQQSTGRLSNGMEEHECHPNTWLLEREESEKPW